MSSLSSVLSALGGAGGPNGVTVATAAVPVGQVQLMPGAQGVSLTLDDGTQWLRSGVIARASDFPTVPASFQADLNPLVRVADVGSGGMWCDIALDPTLGLPIAVSKGAGGWVATMGAADASNAADSVAFNGGTSNLTGSGYTAVNPVKLLSHRGRMAYFFDQSKSSNYAGSIPLWSYDTPGNSYSTATGCGTTMSPTMGAMSAVASNPNGNMVAIRGEGTNQMWYAAAVDGTITAGTMSAPANWSAATFGGALFVAVASGGTVAASSPDGVTWTARTLPASLSWSAVGYGGGKYVALASGSNQGAYSTNGTSWTAMTLPTSRAWCGVTYSASLGLWVAIAADAAFCATSPDGITWTERAMPALASWRNVVFSSTIGAFVAVADCGRAAAAYSLDGTAWVLKALPFVFSVETVFSTGGQSLGALINTAINYTGGMPVIGKSTDGGATWRYYFPSINIGAGPSGPSVIKFMNGLWIAVSKLGTNQVRFLTSADGVTWGIVNPGTGYSNVANDPSTITDLIWNGAVYVLMASYITSGAENYYYVWSSPDLINWTTRSCNTGISGNSSWRGIALPGGAMIVVNNTSFPRSKLMRSTDNGVSWTVVLDPGSSIGNFGFHYDAARDITYASSASNASYTYMSFDKGATWAFASSLQSTLPGESQFIRQGSNGSWVTYGASTVILVRGRLGGGVLQSYSSGFSLKPNKGYGGGGYGVTPVQVGTDTLYLTSANSLVKVDAVKYIDNIRVAGEFNSNYYPGVAVPTLNYYMRVK